MPVQSSALHPAPLAATKIEERSPQRELAQPSPVDPLAREMANELDSGLDDLNPGARRGHSLANSLPLALAPGRTKMNVLYSPENKRSLWPWSTGVDCRDEGIGKGGLRLWRFEPRGLFHFGEAGPWTVPRPWPDLGSWPWVPALWGPQGPLAGLVKLIFSKPLVGKSTGKALNQGDYFGIWGSSWFPGVPLDSREWVPGQVGAQNNRKLALVPGFPHSPVRAHCVLSRPPWYSVNLRVWANFFGGRPLAPVSRCSQGALGVVTSGFRITPLVGEAPWFPTEGILGVNPCFRRCVSPLKWPGCFNREPVLVPRFKWGSPKGLFGPRGTPVSQGCKCANRPPLFARGGWAKNSHTPPGVHLTKKKPKGEQRFKKGGPPQGGEGEPPEERSAQE